MMARLASLGLALGGPAYAAVIVPDPAARWKAIAERLFSTVVQVHGDESQHAAVSSASGVLIGEGLAVTTLEAVAVMGVVVSHVSGEVFTLASKRAIDARFRGGPLFDDRGRLAGILQVSEDGARAVSARAIQRMLDLRALSRGASRPR